MLAVWNEKKEAKKNKNQHKIFRWLFMFWIVRGEQISGVKYTAKEEGKASCLDLPPMFELL